MMKHYLYLVLSILINSFNIYVIDVYIDNYLLRDQLLMLPLIIVLVFNINLLSFIIRCICKNQNPGGYLISQIIFNMLSVMFTIGIFFSMNEIYSKNSNIIFINVSGFTVHSGLCFIIYFIKNQEPILNVPSPPSLIMTTNPLIQQMKSYPIKGFEEMETRYLIKDDGIYLNIENKINPLTLDEFKINDDIIVLSCHHFFEKKELYQWFANSLTCPTCRFSIR